MPDVLLVNPAEKGGFFEKMPPLGLASIAAFLEKNGIIAGIVDFEVEKNDLNYWLSLHKPKFLGISGTTHTRFESFRLARQAKEFSKDIITVYGGVHATFTAVETLKNIQEIDFVIRGEGEKALLELLKTYQSDSDFSSVKGLTFRSEGEVIENPPGPRLSLDSLPRPAYNLLNMKKYLLKMEFLNRRAISMVTSRGCLYRCTFCSASKMFNHLVTNLSAKNIVDDIEFLFKQHGYSGIKFFDSTLTCDRDHIEALCKEITSRDVFFPWECEIRVGSADEKLLTMMKKAGCYYINVGLESGSQKVLDLMRKGCTVEQAQELLQMCKNAGIKTKAFFSFGHIGETVADVDMTFEFIEKNAELISTVASGAGVRIYPGTYLETYARQKRLLPDDFAWSLLYDNERNESILQTRSVPILIQPQLGYDELEQIALRIYSKRFSGWKGFRRGITKVVNPGKLKKLSQLVKLKVKNTIKPRSDQQED